MKSLPPPVLNYTAEEWEQIERVKADYYAAVARRDAERKARKVVPYSAFLEYRARKAAKVASGSRH